MFIPYGKRSEVEILLRDMEAQKHLLICRKGKKTKKIWMQSQIRLLPFGVHEYICPEEDLHIVLSTLDCGDRYNIGKWKLTFLRKVLGYEKIPEPKKTKKYLWITENVNIVLLGIKKDAMDLKEPDGWVHEAI